MKKLKLFHGYSEAQAETLRNSLSGEGGLNPDSEPTPTCLSLLPQFKTPERVEPNVELDSPCYQEQENYDSLAGAHELCGGYESSPRFSRSFELEKGKVFEVPHFDSTTEHRAGILPEGWIEVERRSRNSENLFSKGSKAKLEPGGVVKVIGVSERFGALCRYSTPRGQAVFGSQAPDGCIFFMEAQELLRWSELVHEQYAKIEEREHVIEQLLREEGA